MPADRIRHARPLGIYQPPRYPTREQLRAKPQFLLRHVPQRWRGDRLLLVLLAGTLPLAHGCSQPAAGVAPLSEQGDGVGWFGCEVIVPPVFMSEAEAMAVVKDELAAAGLTGLAEGVPLEDVEVGDLLVGDCDGNISGSATRSHPFEVDLYDEPRLLGIEAYTYEDFEALARDGDPLCDSSVDEINLKEGARVLAEDLADGGAGRWYGVVYDPVNMPDWEDVEECWEEEDPQACEEATVEAALAEGEQLLRAQVQDLVAWMQDNGLL
jgi:hypothetical protein